MTRAVTIFNNEIEIVLRWIKLTILSNQMVDFRRRDQRRSVHNKE